MKKIFPALFLLLCFVSCEKKFESNSSYHLFVHTNYDNDTQFSTFKTFYIPDSILTISDNAKANYLTGNDIKKITNTIVTQMNARGYSRVYNKRYADLGIQTSFVQNDYFIRSYTGSNWWLGYPSYWNPSYWGGWTSWNYPYSISYSYEIGSLLTEIIDLKSVNNTADHRLPVLWSCYMTGLLSGADRLNTDLSVLAINEGFDQSQYITRK